MSPSVTSIATTLARKVNRVRFPRAVKPQPTPDLIRLGSGYGGWTVPESAIRPGAIAYCVGAGTDVTFDLELASRGCAVYCFDPTEHAIVYCQKIEHERFTFHPYGLWSEDTMLRFYSNPRPGHGSLSAVNLHGTDEYVEAPVRSLRSIMRDLQHDHIDILKIDIEGAEHAVIDSLAGDMPSIGVICVEFDQPMPYGRMMETVKRLWSVGFVTTHCERWNVTFVRR